MIAKESRVKKSLLNARVNLIFYFLTLLLSFFSRKIFLDILGADFVGLTGTLQNLLGFLNLAELGIGSAIGYVLYKPLYDHDETKINEIISVFGYLYRWIGFIILGAGGVMACFLPLIFPNTTFDLGVIYFAYGSFLASSLIGYFANYKQTLLGADQKNYVVTAYFQTTMIAKTLIQMASAYYTRSYYLWVGIELIFGITYSFILNWKINQVYPWLNSEVSQGKQLFKKYPEVMKFTKQLFVHKISEFTQFQTTPFIIYAFTSLKTVAYYENYSIVITKLSALILSFLGSTGASIGNLIAEGDQKKIIKVFWEIMAIRIFVGATTAFALYQLMEPFITLWLGHEYILDRSVLIILLTTTFIGLTRRAFEQFLYGYGLFSDTWAPIAESCIGISISILGGYFIGLQGVLLGGIVSQVLIICIWKPYFLFHHGFKTACSSYWKKFSLYIVLSFLPAIGIHWILIPTLSINPSLSFQSWIVYALLTTGLYAVTLLSSMYLLTQGMRDFVQRMIKQRK